MQPFKYVTIILDWMTKISTTFSKKFRRESTLKCDFSATFLVSTLAQGKYLFNAANIRAALVFWSCYKNVTEIKRDEPKLVFSLRIICYTSVLYKKVQLHRKTKSGIGSQRERINVTFIEIGGYWQLLGELV